VETVEKVWRLGMPEYEKWRTYGEVGIFSGELAAVLDLELNDEIGTEA